MLANVRMSLLLVRLFSIQADDVICKLVLRLYFDVGLVERARNM